MHGPEVVLVRHGETLWSRDRKHTGRTDIQLTEEGRRQSERVGETLRGRRFALVLTSPLQRAAETCRLAGLGDVAAFQDELMEWDYGAYEGRTTPEIRAEVPGWSLCATAFPKARTLPMSGAASTPSSPMFELSTATSPSSRTATCCACSPPAGSVSRRRRAGCSPRPGDDLDPRP